MLEQQIHKKITEINSVLLDRNYNAQDIFDFWDECIKIAKSNQQIFTDEFKVSVNGSKLANKLNKKFDLNLLPKIKRHIKNDIKFLMIDASGKVYEFKGIVLDFLCLDSIIELNNLTFTVY